MPVTMRSRRGSARRKLKIARDGSSMAHRSVRTPCAARALLARIGARLDVTALVARDPWFADLPLAGFVRLRDAETGRIRRVFVGKRQRERYRTATAERDAAIRARLAAHGWRIGTLDEHDGRSSLYHAFGVR